MNIVLVGLMGAGKSTVGRLLAKRLGWSFVDTDAVIGAEAGRSIPAIFAAEGEAGFRAREAAVIAAVAAQDRQVIATGGGAVLNPTNRAALRQSGLVFWLDVPPEELYARAATDGVATRPLLAGPDPLGRLQALATERAEAYTAAAHHRVAAGGCSPTEVVAQVLAIIEREKGAGGHATGTR